MIGPRWAVMIPVKPFALGKSRLADDAAARADAARAVALDTIDAVLAADGVDRVVVVTADETLRRGLPMGVEVVRERRPAGIDRALRHAARAVGVDRNRAALPADLAALEPDELTAALGSAAAFPHAVVADAAGSGTTLVTASAGIRWRSAYGPGSFARHAAMGFQPLELPAESGLRHDLDSPADLAGTAALGPRTRTWWESVAQTARS